MEHKKITGITSTVLLVIGALFLFSACSKNQEETSKEQQVSDVVEIPIPQYKIEASECQEPFKCSYDIRIENTFSKEELTLIANELKRNSSTAERIFIGYYLPCMKIGRGTWATSHFSPGLSVNINKFVLPTNPTCLEDIQDLAEVGFFKDEETKVFFKALEKTELDEKSVKEIQDECFAKFKKYVPQDPIEIDRLKPFVGLWVVDISFNYRHDRNQRTYQYSCVYTKSGELLKIITVDKNGINQTSTPLQEKYNL